MTIMAMAMAITMKDATKVFLSHPFPSHFAVILSHNFQSYPLFDVNHGSLDQNNFNMLCIQLLEVKLVGRLEC